MITGSGNPPAERGHLCIGLWEIEPSFCFPPVSGRTWQSPPPRTPRGAQPRVVAPLFSPAAIGVGPWVVDHLPPPFPGCRAEGICCPLSPPLVVPSLGWWCCPPSSPPRAVEPCTAVPPFGSLFLERRQRLCGIPGRCASREQWAARYCDVCAAAPTPDN